MAVSSAMKRTRCGGYAGSSGTYAAPARHTPRIAATSHSSRSSSSPTSEPGRTPASASRRVTARAMVSSSR